MAREISVATTGTVNSATRYHRTGTRQRKLRWARSTTPSRPARPAVTKKAAIPTPSTAPKNPCMGRPNGKIFVSTIGGIATVRKPAPRPSTMNDTTGWRAMMRGSAAIDPLCCWEPRQATADSLDPAPAGCAQVSRLPGGNSSDSCGDGNDQQAEEPADEGECGIAGSGDNQSRAQPAT